MIKIDENVLNFLIENKVSFEQLVRCYNFWDNLTISQRRKAIENYEDGKFMGVGWY